MSPLPPKQIAFTRLEILVAISAIGFSLPLSGPALQVLDGAGSTNNGITDLAYTLELARSHTIANNTFVRIATSCGENFKENL